jgi:hypothetical protein
MFESLSEHMRQDELHARTLRERVEEWVVIAGAGVALFIGLYFAVRFLG